MQQLAFGTDGIRGRVGDFPFTSQALHPLGLTLGHWITTRYGKPNTRTKILVAGDTRESLESIKTSLIAGILAFPIDIIDAGVIPTPAVLTLIKHDHTFSCGLMISASHNPYHDNGLKLFDARTGKLSAQEENAICELFQCYTAQSITEDRPILGTSSSWPSAARNYVGHLVQAVPALIGQGRKIVLDCAHGATHLTAPAVFEKLGAEVIVLNNHPTGTNINDHAGALHPEMLQKMILSVGADIGFAFDGDGDRIVMVSASGEIKDGDDILATLLDLEEYSDTPVVVGTVMSNSGLDAYLKTKSKALARTAVGDKHIAAKLDENSLFLGGEPSGHIVLKNYLASGDGILVAIKILQSLNRSGRWQLDHIKKFPQVTINVPIQAKHDLKNEPYAEILRSYDAMVENGRILVRYSGTEALLRVMVESQDKQKTQDIARNLARTLQQALNA